MIRNPKSNNKQLRCEVDAMTDCLDQSNNVSGGAGAGAGLLSRIFNHLPTDVAHGVLLESAEADPNPVQRIRKYLTAFQRYNIARAFFLGI